MKEFIEIPFGAKDSELCGWEYTIPEGFVASIENGKIIVKKEESEDEKIRKEIIEVFKSLGEGKIHVDINYADIFTWLEKQSEQKPIEATWKPSEEQIKILNEILNFAANHESPYWNDYIFGTLNNLIRQLKKLKA